MIRFNLLELTAVVHPPPHQLGEENVWRLLWLGKSFDRANGCSGSEWGLHMFLMLECFETHHEFRAVIDSLGYSFECSVYSRHNNASFFIFRVVGEPWGWWISTVFCGYSRGGIHSTVFVFSLESESIPFLSWLCLFSWKAGNMWGGLKVELLWALFFLFLHESNFLFMDVFIFARWWNLENDHVALMPWFSCVVQCSSVFNRVIDKLVFCERFGERAGEEKDCFFYSAPYPTISVFLSFQFHPTCFRRVLFMTSIWK